ncbi:MAG: DegT/DnrJ/EryC1/StrS family aminotransferase [Planctomycetota bacterium]
MNVPLLDLKMQHQKIKDDIQQSIQKVIDSQHFIMGPEVAEFETAAAKYIGAKYAIGVASGSDALLLSLMALNIKAGDEVITTAFSFFATAGSIARTGARPVFVDIDPRTFNCDPNWIADALKKHKKAKAIMPVHLYGQCAEMQPIMELAQKHNCAVVEDAAQAIGSTYKGKKAGTMGALTGFSFFPSKNLGGWGDGGLVTTDDDNLGPLVRKLRVHGSSKKYYHQYIGMNSRLDTLQAAVLKAKLKYLDSWSAGRAERAAYYNKLFQSTGLPDTITTPYVHPDCNHIYHQYTIIVKGKPFGPSPQDKRDGLRDFLKERGIGTEVYYPLPLHLQECFTYMGYKPGDLPVSEKASLEALSLPIYPELTSQQQDYVVENIKAFMGK